MDRLLLGVVIFCGIQLTTADSGPQQKFIKATAHFYISTNVRSFIGAWLDCKTGGMELASVESEEEQLELNNATAAADYHSSEGYWIGGVDEYQGSNTWYWLDSTLRIIYTNWGTNQPGYYTNDYRRQCLRLGSFYKVDEPYKWENIDCGTELYYVCKSKSS